MSSFSCPHYDSQTDDCVRLGAECVPGRPGCVLFGNSVFAVPWQQRLREKQAERAARNTSVPIPLPNRELNRRPAV